MKEDETMVSFVCPQELWGDLKEVASRKRVPASVIIRDLLEKYTSAYFKRTKK